MEFQKDASPIEALENAAPRIAEKRKRMDALLPKPDDDRFEEDRRRIIGSYEQALEQNPEDGSKPAISALARLMMAAKERGAEHPSLALAKAVAARLLDLDRSSDLSWSESAYQYAMDLAEIEPHLTDSLVVKAAKEKARAKLDSGRSIRDCLLEIAAIRSARKEDGSIRCALDAEAKWYMVIVQSTKEQEARDALSRYNIRTLWPHYYDLMPAKQVKNGRVCRKPVFQPIIAGVLFCNTCLNKHFLDVTRLLTPGFIDIARDRFRNPIELSKSDIERLLKIEEGLKGLPGAKVIHDFKMGEKVKFIGGGWPLGRITGLYRGGRIGVEVSVMGGRRVVMVLPHLIERM